MSTRPPGTARAAAARAANQVARRRAKALQQHEHEITALLTDYFEAKALSETIRESARVDAGRILADADAKAEELVTDAHAAAAHVTDQAERDAADADAQVGQAVRRLLALGESKPAVAEMTGLSPAVVRAMAREHLDHPATRRADQQASSH